jgi:hypothetical protein
MAGRPWPPQHGGALHGSSRDQSAEAGQELGVEHPSIWRWEPTIHARGNAVALAWLDLLDELADELEQDGPRAQQ